MPTAIAWHALARRALGAAACVVTFGCHRPAIAPYGQCGAYAPEGAATASATFERGTAAVLRVRAGDDVGAALSVSYRLTAAGDTATLLRAVSDTGLAISGLRAGRYVLRSHAIAHLPLAVTFDFGPDTGAAATLRLERGALSLCEDGIRARRL